MKNKIVFWLVMIGIALLAVWAGQQLFRLSAENQELRWKISQLQVSLSHAMIPMEQGTVRDSLPVAKQEVVTIDKTDYKQQAADRELIKELRLKIKEVESENRMLLETRDTVKLEPVGGTAGHSVDSVLKYKDRWCQFVYNVENRQLDYRVMDSLVTIVSRVPKHRFLWWRWGTKGYEVNIVNFNPKGKVVYNKYLKVE